VRWTDKLKSEKALAAAVVECLGLKIP